ncbi:hypothetical protein HUJ05_009818 [Dendroctonus ponderosae]|nr:hypothetical protein HUJ05_009818 [Dendroctonus ponderosae]
MSQTLAKNWLKSNMGSTNYICMDRKDPLKDGSYFFGYLFKRLEQSNVKVAGRNSSEFKLKKPAYLVYGLLWKVQIFKNLTRGYLKKHLNSTSVV